MAGRIRSIKPEWLENERLARCSSDARLLSVALICLADDHGNGRGSPEYLRAQVWAYSRDSRETLAKVLERVASALAELEAAAYVVLYTADGQSYFHLPGWGRHQKVDKVGKPRVPAPSNEARESYRESRETRAPDLDHEHRNVGGGSRSRPARRAREPTPDIPLPDDWAPTEAHVKRAQDSGLDLADQVTRFKLHAETHARTAASWNGAFTTWLLNAPDFKRAQAHRSGAAPVRDHAAEIWREAQALKEQGR